MRDWKVVAEVFPGEESPNFEVYSCAAAAFYVRSESGDQAVHITEQELALDGWHLAATIGLEPIKGDTVLLESLDRGTYVCNLRRVPRIVVSISRNEGACDLPIAPNYREFMARARTEGFVLRKVDVKYETFVLQGQTVVPVWVNRDDPEKWCEHWSVDRRVERLNVKTFVSAIANGLGDDALLALGLVPGTLVTFHPRAVIASARKMEEM